jgi:exosortase B
VPTYVFLADQIWHVDQHAHGPIILAIFLFLVWRKRNVLTIQTVTRSEMLLGWVSVGLGLGLYAIGVSQAVISIEVFSQLPLLFGITLLAGGWSMSRHLMFPIVFLFFLVPLPFFIVDFLTGGLKETVSSVVAELLYTFGYPIARQGVVLQVGPYQLLIEDACSGLNSMYTITALGALFIYLKGWSGKLRLGLFLLSLIPIAFAANVLRVMSLTLITYHFGDAAGRGFVHDFAAAAEFFIALLIMFAVDMMLRKIRI